MSGGVFGKLIRAPVIAALGLAAGGLMTSAQADFWSDAGKAVEKGLHDTGNAIEKGAHDTGNAIEKGAHDAGNAIEKGAHDTGNAIEKGAHDSGNAIEKGAHDTGNAIEKGAHDTGNAIEKGAHDTGNAIEKGLHDTGKAAEKAVRDLGTAGETIGQFVGNELKGVYKSLSDAEKRAREGKIVDAVWHLSTDPVKHTEENAATAVQKSNILNAAAQYAATVYGGPGGAAAYTAWYTYRVTGNAEMALRMAVISGVSSAISAAGKLPTDTSAQVAEKLVVTGALGGGAAALSGGNFKDGFIQSSVASIAGSVTGKLPPAQQVVVTNAITGTAAALAGGDAQAIKDGIIQSGVASLRVAEGLRGDGLMRKALINSAIGGLAVAASGGNESAVKDGFLRSGGMVLVQNYEKVVHDQVSRLTESKVFCMESRAIGCSRPLDRYVGQVSAWSAEKIAPAIDSVSKVISVRKTSALNEKTLALNESVFIKWDMDALTNPAPGVPAVVLSIPSVPEQASARNESSAVAPGKSIDPSVVNVESSLAKEDQQPHVTALEEQQARKPAQQRGAQLTKAADPIVYKGQLRFDSTGCTFTTLRGTAINYRCALNEGNGLALTFGTYEWKVFAKKSLPNGALSGLYKGVDMPKGNLLLALGKDVLKGGADRTTTLEPTLVPVGLRVAVGATQLEVRR